MIMITMVNKLHYGDIGLCLRVKKKELKMLFNLRQLSENKEYKIIVLQISLI